MEHGASRGIINQRGTLRKSSARRSTGTGEAYGSWPSSAREGKRKLSRGGGCTGVRGAGRWTWGESRPRSSRRGSISGVIAVRNSCDKSTIGVLYGEYEAASCTGCTLPRESTPIFTSPARKVQLHGVQSEFRLPPCVNSMKTLERVLRCSLLCHCSQFASNRGA